MVVHQYANGKLSTTGMVGMRRFVVGFWPLTVWSSLVGMNVIPFLSYNACPSKSDNKM